MCVSDVFNAYTSLEKGDYLNKVAKTNAAQSKQMAADSLQRGDLAADEQRIQTKQIIGTQRTGFAANGIDVNSGSAGRIQNDSAALGELDALTIMNNAAREAYGYQVQATNQLQSGKLAKYEGKTDAIGSILGGATKAATFAAGGA